MADLLENLMDDIKLTQRLFKEDRVTEAYFLLQNLERFSKELRPELQVAVNKELDKSEVIKSLRSEGARNAKLLALFEDSDSWNDWTSGVGTNQDVVVGIHKDEPRGQYYFKVEGRIQCDLLHVLAAILENELYKVWMPLCTSSKNVAAMSPYRRIVHTKLDFALLQKEALYVAHGDILPDGGVLVTMAPTTEDEEAKHVSRTLANNLPPQEDRLDITGGFLLYEELEDNAGNSLSAAFSEYEAHSERLRSAGGPSQAKVLRRKTQSTYRKQFSFTGSDTGGPTRALDLSAVATMSLANDKEYNDRMLTLGKKKRATRHMTEKETLAAQTLDRYKLSIQELYEVQPPGGTGTGLASTGLADTANPMLAGRKLEKGTPSTASLTGLLGETSKGRNSVAGVRPEKKTVLVKAIINIDPKLQFMPDWIFNMAVRSAAAMIIPMMEFQAQQFCEGGMFHQKIGQHLSLYNEIERRLSELKESNQQPEEKEEVNHYVLAQQEQRKQQQERTLQARRGSGISVAAAPAQAALGEGEESQPGSFGRRESDSDDELDLYESYPAIERLNNPLPNVYT